MKFNPEKKTQIRTKQTPAPAMMTKKKIIETLKCNARKKNPKNQSQFWIEIHWKKSNDKPPNKVECFDKLNQTRAHNSTESHAVWH